MNPPKAERAKPSLSSDYNLLFKNKIGESSLDIHRTLYLQCLNSALRRFRLLRPRLTSQPASLRLATSVAIGTGRDLPGYHTCASRPTCRIYTSPFRAATGLTELRQLSQTLCLISDSCLSGWRFAIGFLHRFVASSTLLIR